MFPEEGFIHRGRASPTFQGTAGACPSAPEGGHLGGGHSLDLVSPGALWLCPGPQQGFRFPCDFGELPDFPADPGF